VPEILKRCQFRMSQAFASAPEAAQITIAGSMAPYLTPNTAGFTDRGRFRHSPAGGSK
jgi:hypothetical protein